MSSTLRVLHAANILLGNTYTGLAPDLCRERYFKFPEVFDSLFAYIEKEQIDLVLFSGNLCSRYLTSSDAAHLLKKLKDAPCRFVSAPGDQDSYANDSFYASGRLPTNVSVFTGEQSERIDFDDLGVSVYGWAILSQRIKISPLAGSSVADPDRINLLVGSCNMEENSLYAHVTVSDLINFGADYAALAHGAATEMRVAGRTHYCHAGFLEGRNFEETGIGGVWRIDIDREDDGTRRVRTSFVPLSRHRYEVITLDITGVTDMSEVTERTAAAIAERGYGEETSLRVILEGELPPTAILRHRPEEGNSFALYSIEFVDRTLPTLNTELLERDMSVRGELYRTLLSRLSSPNLDDRIAAAEALRAGLAALESRDITVF